jgi:hypothetical protein
MDIKNKSATKILTSTNEDRIHEELIRPRIETFVDEWGAWVAYHRAKDKGEEYSPHFGVGWH